MNIKSILPQIFSLESRAQVEHKQVTLEESQDRDPNGHPESESELPRRKMTEEELDKVLDVIKALPGVESSSLTVKLIKGEEGHAAVIIIGPKGEIIRRLTEVDLWRVLSHQEKKTGQIFDKAM